jgi:hypothetical protein
MRRGYDRQLDLFGKRQKSRQVDPNAPRSRIRSRPGPTVGEGTGFVSTFAGIVAVLCVGFGIMAWFSFQMPWAKLEKDVDVAHGQPAQPVVQQHAQPQVQNPIEEVVVEQPIAQAPDSATTVAQTENSPESVGADASSDEEKPVSTIELLDEKLLDSWQPPKKTEDISNWSLSDGELTMKSAGPSLRTKQTFRDFDLHLEFKLPPKCNTGVFLRGRYEVQLVDSQVRKNDGTPFDPVQKCGAIYGQIAPITDTYRGSNKWNSLDVRLVGETVTVRMNDTLIIDAEKLKGPTAGSLDENEFDPGPIFLQSHAVSGLAFRNITIKSLADAAEPPTEDADNKFPKPVLQLTFDANQTEGVQPELHGAKYVKGKVGKALQFDGRTFASVNATLPIGNAHRSLAVWLKDTRGPLEQRLIHPVTQGHKAGTTFGIMQASGKWRFFDFNGGLDSGHQVDREWHHHCVTSDGSTIIYYFDGVKSSEVKRVLNTAVAPLMLGTFGDDEEPEKRFVGLIDELKIFGVALSSEQVSDVMAED